MNANKIQSVISSCLRRAQSSVAMGTVKSVLDQQRNHTYLSALFFMPSLTPVLVSNHTCFPGTGIALPDAIPDSKYFPLT